MTAICPSGGTSSPKTGLAEVVAVSSGALALAMQRNGAAKLQFLIPLLGLAPLELPTFCATDPPALPTLTSDEVYSLFFLRLDADFYSGLAKARDLVLRMLWYDLCECDTPSATPFVNPTLPTDTPDPIGPSYNPGACASYTFSDSILVGSPDVVHTITGLVGTGVTAYQVVFTASPSTSLMDCQCIHGQFNDSNVQVGSNQNVHIFTATTVPQTRQYDSIPSLDKLVFTFHAAGNTGTTYAMSVTVNLYCGTQPNAAPTPCCPPDPATQSYLDLILQMVTLIQRQAAPFSYVYGANHASLTGHGSFAVSSLLGVSVDVTTLPGNYGSAVGSPDTLFDLGYVNLGTADGWTQSRRIDHDGALFIPPSGGLYTAVGYSLSAGVEVAIRELVREP